MAHATEGLPSSALWTIVQELEPRTLARLACTSRELQDMTEASTLWPEFCSENFPLRICLKQSGDGPVASFSWKQLYQELQLGCHIAVDLTRTKIALKDEGGLTADAFMLEDAIYNMFYQNGWVFPVAGRSSLTVFFSIAQPSSFGYCLRLTHLSSQSASMPTVVGMSSMIQVHLNGRVWFDRHVVPIGDYQSEDFIVGMDMVHLNQANSITITICPDAEAIYWLQRVELFHAMLSSPLAASSPKMHKDISYPDWVAQSIADA